MEENRDIFGKINTTPTVTVVVVLIKKKYLEVFQHISAGRPREESATAVEMSGNFNL